jgi:hypothetical protein
MNTSSYKNDSGEVGRMVMLQFGVSSEANKVPQWEVCHEGYGSGAFRWRQLKVMRRKRHYGRTLTTPIF